MNVQKLKGKIVENGMNVETFAKKIGVARTSIYRKLNNSQFTIGEVRKIKETLGLSNEEAIAIFFD